MRTGAGGIRGGPGGAAVRGTDDAWPWRQGPQDEARHEERVREALRACIADLVADPALVEGGAGSVALPAYALREFRFRFSDPAAGAAGGEVGGAGGGGAPPGAPAGREPGRDELEAEVGVEALEQIVFADLHLPALAPKPGAGVPAPGRRGSAVRRRGSPAALDRRRSLQANLLRHAREGRPKVGAWADEDLRFRAPRPRPRGETAAAVIVMRDVSGSMGEFKKALARGFFFWMVRFLRARYAGVEPVFIAHHTVAREVGEEAFFALAESGGTKVSAAYELALGIMRARYDAAHWNIYACHFSDGDNWGDEDNARCVQLAREMLGRASALGYAETAEPGYRSPLLSALQAIDNPRLVTMSLHGRRDVLGALRRFFHAPGDT